MAEQGDGKVDQINLSPAEIFVKRELGQAAKYSGEMPIQWEAVNDLAYKATLENRLNETDRGSKAEADAKKNLKDHEDKMSAKKTDNKTGADYRASFVAFNGHVGRIQEEMRPAVEKEFADSILDKDQILVMRANNRFVELYNQTVAQYVRVIQN